jgi:hypothetical protein
LGRKQRVDRVYKSIIPQPRLNAREILDRISIIGIMVALGFERPRHGTRTRCILHGGDGLNFAFKEKEGTWYCHSGCNEGGGKIKLVQRALGLDKKAALTWIAELAGIPLKPWTEEQRREDAQRCAAAQPEADEFVAWKNSILDSLRAARDIYSGAYLRCRRFIVTHGLDDPQSDEIATLCETYEARYQELDRRIAAVGNVPVETLLAFFRARRAGAAA